MVHKNRTLLIASRGKNDVMYTDLEKAFGKISNKRLISKLYGYDLNKDIISWIEAVL